MTAEVGDEVREAALHGSYCPKMCNFACPVTAATGRADAMPWSFHRTVTDLVDGRTEQDGTLATRLEACSGCRACQVPCLFDQDVPAQVRAGRAVAVDRGEAAPAVADAVDAAAAGRSPYGLDPVAESGPPSKAGTTVLLAGCRADARVVDAAQCLFHAAGIEHTAVAAPGCCGGVLDDLGATAAAEQRHEMLRAELDGAGRVVALDPHCVSALRQALPTIEIAEAVPELARLQTQGALRLSGADDAVTYHDPCLHARPATGTPVLSEPRALLRAAGARLVPPEHSEQTTACSGAGLGMDLLAPDAARATASRRAEQLATAGGAPVTACAGAVRALDSAGATTTHLLVHLAERLAPTTTRDGLGGDGS